jgi:excisionase family DNA binding protein
MTAPARRWLKPREAAEILAVDEQTVYRLCRAGKLPFAKVGGNVRIDGLRLQVYMEAQSKSSGAGMMMK